MREQAYVEAQRKDVVCINFEEYYIVRGKSWAVYRPGDDLTCLTSTECALRCSRWSEVMRVNFDGSPSTNSFSCCTVLNCHHS